MRLSAAAVFAPESRLFEEVEDPGFPSTFWPAVAEAGHGQHSRALEALDSIVRAYNKPLKSHLRRKFFLNDDQASDILQSFIEKKVLERGLLSVASKGRGRFRTFLLAALDRFVVSEHRRRNSLKRSPGLELASLEDLASYDELQFAENPNVQFDVEWARGLLSMTIERMRNDCIARGQLALWEIFEGRLLKPLLDGSSSAPYEELVHRLALESPAQAFNLLASGKRIFARHLRALIGEYCPDELGVEVEIRELRAVLASHRHAPEVGL